MSRRNMPAYVQVLEDKALFDSPRSAGPIAMLMYYTRTSLIPLVFHIAIRVSNPAGV